MSDRFEDREALAAKISWEVVGVTVPDKTPGEILHEAREAGNDGRDRPMFLASWAERNPRLKMLDEAMAAAVAKAERERIAADPETPLSDALHTLGEVQRIAESMVMSRNPMERECGRRVLAVIGPQGDEETGESPQFQAAPGSLRIYLAGPMRGVPEFNHPAFNAATALLREAGHAVFNPAEYDRSKGYDFTGHDGTEDLAAVGFDLRRALGTDLAWITANADAVVVLPGWEKSAGAAAETATARALGLPVCEIGAFLANSLEPAAPLAADLDGPEMPGQLEFPEVPS